jgi:hypothetical protein
MRRALLCTAVASLGIATLALACSGESEQSKGAPVLTTEPTPAARAPDAGAPDADAMPPRRDVTAPVIVDLGNVAPGATVTLAVPESTLGFNIVVESRTDPGAFVGIERITSPSGEVVHDDFTPKGGSHATSESSVGAIATVSVPQSEARAANRPEPGRWAIRIGAGAPDGGSASLAGSPDGPAETFHVEAHIQIGHTEGFVGRALALHGASTHSSTLSSRSSGSIAAT